MSGLARISAQPLCVALAQSMLKNRDPGKAPQLAGLALL